MLGLSDSLCRRLIFSRCCCRGEQDDNSYVRCRLTTIGEHISCEDNCYNNVPALLMVDLLSFRKPCNVPNKSVPNKSSLKFHVIICEARVRESDK